MKKPYPDPFIPERADPFVTKGGDLYYFTASYPAFGSAENGYDRIVLRCSNTVSGLATAQEKTVWKAHDEGVMARHIWAPEMHYIENKWYIFFAAGEKENVWNIRPYVLACSGDDPMKDEWLEKGRMQKLPEDTMSFENFSLDMTYFSVGGKHYVIWAQIEGDSSLFMAEIDPKAPWKIISLPLLLSKPEFDWEKIRFRVNEGPSVVFEKDKVIVFFSASGTGAEYCMGMLYADKNADLMNAKSWTKLSHPVLATKDLCGQVGPGHNSFVKDENGNLLIVYHARPESHLQKECGSFDEESLYDPCRHARVKYLSFDGQLKPVFA